MNGRLRFLLIFLGTLCTASTALFGQAHWGLLSAYAYTNNTFTFQVEGATGNIYRLELSTNLSQWQTFGVAINETGAVSLIDKSASRSPNSFYRVVVDSAAHSVVESYCSRANVRSPQAKLALYQFADGINALGLLTNLVDFAFFSQGLQPATANPISWRNTGTIVGNINRLRGGLELPNYLSTNYFFFTNLPPTPNGRTLILWAAGNLNPSGISQDNGIALIEMTSAGPWPQSMDQMFYSNGGYSPYNWNGSFQRIGPSWYAYSGYENSLFCLGLSSSASGYEICLNRDNFPDDSFDWAGTDNTAASPTIIRFGIRNNFQPPSAWNGIYRGFAYLDTVLSRAQIMQINLLVPRVGLIIEGDSKSVLQSPSIYSQWWLNIPQTWALYSLRTNSAISGTRVAAANAPYHNSMEERFAADAALGTNSQFPIILYSLRGGHNDFINTDLATQACTDNAFMAVTNLWAMARTNGFQVVGWTIDRTAVTWSGGDPGNSNMLASINGRLRQNQTLCDFLVDAEMWYVANFGETPYTNTALYRDGVHDIPAAPLLGTNLLGAFPWPGLGYEAPL